MPPGRWRAIVGLTMDIAFVLYDDFTGLDLVGPYEVIGAWPDARVRFVATAERAVKADGGLVVLPTDTPGSLPNPDLVVIPARPSPHDLRAAGATVELVERMGKQLVFVINAATPRARITAEAVMALSQHGTLAPVILHHRTGFAASMIDGRTVMEVPGEARSAEEIALLWEYLGNRLNRDFRTMLPNQILSAAAKGEDQPIAVGQQGAD